MTTNITDAHRHAFEALTSGQYNNFALFSCAVDGAPAAAIVAVNECPPDHDGAEPEYTLHPLFVSVTPTMTLTDHDGMEASPLAKPPDDGRSMNATLARRSRTQIPSVESGDPAGRGPAAERRPRRSVFPPFGARP